MSAAKPGARLAVDIGGTFTDIVLEARGRRWTGKVLTTPRAPEDAVIAAVKEILAEAELAPNALELFILGTTLATNALIERKGAKTALVTTEGFRDLVEIGWEHRFAQYDIFLTSRRRWCRATCACRCPSASTRKGRVLLPLDEAAVKALVPELQQQGIESVAIAFLQSFTNTAHERRAKEILSRELPDLWITLSSDVCPEIREYERISTTCANAYVQPVMAGYLNRLQARLEAMGIRCPVYLMTSGGALCTLAMGATEPCASSNRVRPAARSSRARSPRAAAPTRVVVRHGRHHGEDLLHRRLRRRRFRAASNSAACTGSSKAAACRSASR